MNKSCKTWDFTINNYTDKDLSVLRSWEDDVGRLVVAKEIGDEGTPHLQGRVTFKRSYRLSGLKKLHSKAHWEETSCKQDFLYCKKYDGELTINVNNSSQGQRSDLDRVAEMIKKGNSVRDICLEETITFIKFHKGIERAHDLIVTDKSAQSEYSLIDCSKYIKQAPLNWAERNGRGVTEVLIGPPNCGKTQFALAHFNQPLLVSHLDDLKRFDPTNHDGIVFDDIDFKHLPRTAQIHLTDWSCDRSIHARFVCSKIPKHTRKIVCCNEYPFSDDTAIASRVTVTEVTSR